MNYEWGIDAFTLTLSRQDKEMLSKILNAAPSLAPVVKETPAQRIQEVARLVQIACADEPFRISREDFNEINRIIFTIHYDVKMAIEEADSFARLKKAWPGVIPRWSGEGMRSARFSLDDRWLLVQSRGKAHVWDLIAGKTVEQHEAADFASFMLQSDHWCIAGPIWRVWTGQEIERSPGVEALIARNHRLGLLRKGESALLLNLETQEPVGAFKESYPSESCVALSPDGRWLLNSGTDSMPCLRDASSGELIRRLEGHKGLVYTATFSEDARWAVTASADHTARIWDLRTGSWMAALHSGSGGAWMLIDPDLRYDVWEVVAADDSYWLEALGAAGWGQHYGRYTPGLLPSILASPDG